jgi:hypothetical protein
MTTLKYAVFIITTTFSLAITNCITFYGFVDNKENVNVYSFPVSNELVEENNITFEMEKLFNNMFDKNSNRKKPNTSESGIATLGLISPHGAVYGKEINFIQKDNVITFLPSYHRRYTLNGSVTTGGVTAPAVLDVEVYGDTPTGGGDLKMLHHAAIDNVNFDLYEPIGFDNINEFPKAVGGGFIDGDPYRIYMVHDIVSNSMLSRWYQNLFLHGLQKFQFVCDSDTVIAELEGDTYYIYNTKPSLKKLSIKYAISLFFIFRQLEAYFDKSESWDIPWT